MKFKEYSFRDLLINIVDNRGRTCPTVEQGIPLIATNCIKNTGLYPVYEKLRYVSEETYNSWFRDHPKPGDMVFVCKGSPGRVCWVSDPVPFCIAQDMVAIRADETIVYPKYLFALLRSEVVQNQILNMHVGTLIPHFKKGDFANLYLQVPEDMEYQKQVGDVYFSFCEKIENNHQINQTLEQMAQAIFKSWFVDFEPVKTKITVLEAGGSAEDALLAAMQAISGKNEALLNQLQTEQPEQYAELRATAELFPSAMQESELGEIPEGWTVTNLESLSVTITKGTTPTKSDIDGADDLAEVPFIKVKDISNNGEILSEGLDLIPLSVHKGVLKRSILIKDDLLFSIAGTIGRVAIVTEELDGANTNQAVGIVRLKDKNTYLPLIWQILKSDRAQNDIASKVVQGVQANASLKNLRDIHVLLPNEYILKIVTSNLSSILQQIATKYRENRTLAKVREILLPELLSGELQLPEGEVQIQEAADAV